MSDKFRSHLGELPIVFIIINCSGVYFQSKNLGNKMLSSGPLANQVTLVEFWDHLHVRTCLEEGFVREVHLNFSGVFGTAIYLPWDAFQPMLMVIVDKNLKDSTKVKKLKCQNSYYFMIKSFNTLQCYLLSLFCKKKNNEQHLNLRWH